MFSVLVDRCLPSSLGSALGNRSGLGTLYTSPKSRVTPHRDPPSHCRVVVWTQRGSESDDVGTWGVSFGERGKSRGVRREDPSSPGVGPSKSPRSLGGDESVLARSLIHHKWGVVRKFTRDNPKSESSVLLTPSLSEFRKTDFLDGFQWCELDLSLGPLPLTTPNLQERFYGQL